MIGFIVLVWLNILILQIPIQASYGWHGLLQMGTYYAQSSLYPWDRIVYKILVFILLILLVQNLMRLRWERAKNLYISIVSLPFVWYIVVYFVGFNLDKCFKTSYIPGYKCPDPTQPLGKILVINLVVAGVTVLFSNWAKKQIIIKNNK